MEAQLQQQQQQQQQQASQSADTPVIPEEYPEILPPVPEDTTTVRRRKDAKRECKNRRDPGEQVIAPPFSVLYFLHIYFLYLCMEVVW